MTFNWKQALGSVALSAMALSMIGTGGAVAQTKPDPVKPTPPTAEKIETGQLLIKDKPRPPSVERGIKDPGVKSCGSCGMTGKEAAPPPVDDAAAPGSEQRKFNDQWSGAPPSAEKVETGQIRIRDRPKIVNERRAHSGPGGTPPSTAKTKKGKGPKEKESHGYSTPLTVVGGVAALAAILASGNNDDNPTSP